MTRKKKSRKTSQLAPKFEGKKKSEVKAESKRKGKGLKPGSRHSAGKLSAAHAAKNAKDPMLGSKKPIELVPTNRPKFDRKAAEIRLLQLENDPHLVRLLAKLDNGANIASTDEKWLNAQLREIESLMVKLGIDIDDELADDFEDDFTIESPESGVKSSSISKVKTEDDMLDAFDGADQFLNDLQDK